MTYLGLVLVVPVFGTGGVKALNNIIFVVLVCPFFSTLTAVVVFALFHSCEVFFWVIVVWVVQVVDTSCWLVNITITTTTRAVFALATASACWREFLFHFVRNISPSLSVAGVGVAFGVSKCLNDFVEFILI